MPRLRGSEADGLLEKSGSFFVAPRLAAIMIFPCRPAVGDVLSLVFQVAFVPPRLPENLCADMAIQLVLPDIVEHGGGEVGAGVFGGELLADLAGADGQRLGLQDVQAALG